MKNVFLFLTLTLLTSCEPKGYGDLVKGHNGLTTLANKNFDDIKQLQEVNKELAEKVANHDLTYRDIGKFTGKNARGIAANLDYFTRLADIVDSLKSENKELKLYVQFHNAKVTELNKRLMELEEKVK